MSVLVTSAVALVLPLMGGLPPLDDALDDPFSLRDNFSRLCHLLVVALQATGQNYRGIPL